MDFSGDSSRVTYQQIIEDVDTSNWKTKIMATIGENCNTEEVLTEMLDAGMNIVRLKFGEEDNKVSYVHVRLMKAGWMHLKLL